MKKAIHTRQSQRSFDGRELSVADEKKILDYICDKTKLVGPFGTRITIHYIETSGQSMEKISTYGVVKNAPGYLVTVCKNDAKGMIDCGYVMEKLILFLEISGIGTCWLGGTYKRNQLNVPVGEGEIIPIISPVGYVANKRALSDKIVRGLAGSNKRKAFDELFFMNDFKHPIQDPELMNRLEHVQIAPSASNKQPWRIVMDDSNTAHLFLERTPNYGYGKLPYDIQMVDMGIAISHYEIAKGEVEFVEEKPEMKLLSEFSEFVVSMK